MGTFIRIAIERREVNGFKRHLRNKIARTWNELYWGRQGGRVSSMDDSGSWFVKLRDS